MEIDKLWVSLALEAADYARGLQQATNDGVAWARSWGSRVSSTLSAAFKAGMAGLAVVAGIFAAIGGAAINMNAQLETSTLQFETLMGDADAAKDHVEALFEFAKSTPFETQPIIDASRMMQTFGGSALNTMDNLTLVGDAAAATGAPINDVAFWVGRMYAALQAGKPIGEAVQNLSQLAVISPEAALEMERLMEAGASADEVFAAFQGDLGRFTGAMEKQAGTWDGLMSTISDALKITAATALKPFFDLAKTGLEGLATFLSGDAVANGAAFLAEKISAVGTAVGLFIDRVQNGEPLLQSLETLVTQIGLVFGMNSTEARALGERFGEIVVQIQTFITEVQNLLEPVITAVTQFVTWNDALIAFGIILAAVIIPGLISAVVSLAAFVAPILLLIGLVALLRTAWEENWGGIQEKVAAFSEWLTTVAIPAIQEFATNAQTYITTVLIPAFNEFLDQVKPKLEEFGVWLVETAIPAIQQFATDAQTFIVETLLPAFNQFSEWFIANEETITGVLTAIVVGIGAFAIISTVVGWITGLIATISALGGAISAAGGIIGAIVAVLGGPLTLAIAAVAAIIGLLTAAWVNNWGDIQGKTATAVAFIKTTLQNAWVTIQQLGAILAFVALQIIKWWDQLGVTVEQLGTIISLTWDAIKEAVETAVDNVVSSVEDIIAVFTETDWSELGQAIIDGIVNAIIAGVTDIVNAVGELADSAAAAWDNFWDSDSPSRRAYNQAGDVVAGYAGGLGDGVSVMSEMGQNLGMAIVEAMQTSGLEGIEDAVAEAIADAAEAGEVLTAEMIEGIRERVRLANLDDLLGVGSSLGSFGRAIADRFTREVLDPIQAQMEGLDAGIADIASQRDIALRQIATLAGVDVGQVNALMPQIHLQAVLENNRPLLAVIQGLNNLNAESADLEQQRAEAAAEYAAQQERILELQKQQADLAFLQQQLDLLQTIQDAGLNPADVLDGITLGLDASLPDLIEAMNSAMAAIIAAAEGELQISSPSRVFARIGEFINRGLAIGLEDVSPIDRAMERVNGALTRLEPVGTGDSYSAQTTVQLAPGQDPMRALRASRHLDKLRWT